MEQYYLAVDIGASSGRHILGWQEDGVLKLEEIYRFENGYAEQEGKKLWDTGRLFAEKWDEAVQPHRQDPRFYGDRHLGGGLRALGWSGSGGWRHLQLPGQPDRGNGRSSVPMDLTGSAL